MSCGDIWSCLRFDPLYPNYPNCCVSLASVPFGSDLACDALTHTGRACWDTCWCPVLWLGHSTDLMFSDWISVDIPSLQRTTLFKPSPHVKLWSVIAGLFFLWHSGNTGGLTLTWWGWVALHNGCHQVFVSPVIKHPALQFAWRRWLKSDKSEINVFFMVNSRVFLFFHTFSRQSLSSWKHQMSSDIICRQACTYWFNFNTETKANDLFLWRNATDKVEKSSKSCTEAQSLEGKRLSGYPFALYYNKNVTFFHIQSSSRVCSFFFYLVFY